MDIEEEDSLADDLFANSEYKAARPVKKDFLPWHRPRKQYVRQMQWCAQINTMVSEMLPENKVLKYLGLPGEDLLDLRYLHEHICVPHQIGLKFLGFNTGIKLESRGVEANISLHEVKQLRFVDPSSNVIADDICQIADPASIAWKHSREMGTYDVINIDLCDGFGKHPINEFQETHYNTLSQLLTLQARRTNPWMLLLTTRTGSRHVNPLVFKRLKELYVKNLSDCASFMDFSKREFSITDEDSLEHMLSNPRRGADVFLVALCKWIGSLCLVQNPPANVEVTNVMGYTVYAGAGHPDLASISIKITPTFLPPHDRVGLATHPHSPLSECDVALQAIEQTHGLMDVDEQLKRHSDVLNAMINASSVLLEEARYDGQSYQDWARRV